MDEKKQRARTLEEAYRMHVDAVFGLCLKFAGGDRHWALDRCHDTFMRLHDRLPALDLTHDLAPWLRKVAVNECLLDLRRRDRRRKLLSVFGGGGAQHAAASPERQAQDDRDVRALDAALARLPAKQRMLLALMYFEDETLTEAGASIGVSKGQASKLHKQALAALGKLDWETAR